MLEARWSRGSPRIFADSFFSPDVLSHTQKTKVDFTCLSRALRRPVARMAHPNAAACDGHVPAWPEERISWSSAVDAGSGGSGAPNACASPLPHAALSLTASPARAGAGAMSGGWRCLDATHGAECER